MPIIPLLVSDGFFDPEATKVLTAAFDTAWQMLKTSGNVLAADYYVCLHTWITRQAHP